MATVFEVEQTLRDSFPFLDVKKLDVVDTDQGASLCTLGEPQVCANGLAALESTSDDSERFRVVGFVRPQFKTCFECTVYQRCKGIEIRESQTEHPRESLPPAVEKYLQEWL